MRVRTPTGWQIVPTRTWNGVQWLLIPARGWDGSRWVIVPGAGAAFSSAPPVDKTEDNREHWLVQSDRDFEVSGEGFIDILVIGGGGGSTVRTGQFDASGWSSGGGGAGQVSLLQTFRVLPGDRLRCEIGQGGTGATVRGGTSVVTLRRNQLDSEIVQAGGGGGGGQQVPGDSPLGSLTRLPTDGNTITGGWQVVAQAGGGGGAGATQFTPNPGFGSIQSQSRQRGEGNGGDGGTFLHTFPEDTNANRRAAIGGGGGGAGGPGFDGLGSGTPSNIAGRGGPALDMWGYQIGEGGRQVLGRLFGNSAFTSSTTSIGGDGGMHPDTSFTQTLGRNHNGQRGAIVIRSFVRP